MSSRTFSYYSLPGQKIENSTHLADFSWMWQEWLLFRESSLAPIPSKDFLRNPMEDIQEGLKRIERLKKLVRGRQT
jgi:hypothetical protein